MPKSQYIRRRDELVEKAMSALERGDFMYAPIYMDMAHKTHPVTQSQVDAFNRLAIQMQIGREYSLRQTHLANPARQSQIGMGIEVEKEHADLWGWIRQRTPDFAMSLEEFAAAIAKAHIAEFPNYYSLLRRMEAEGKRQNIKRIKSRRSRRR